MRVLLIALVLYVGVYAGVRTIYMTGPQDARVVLYPVDMFWLYAFFWPASEADARLTGVPSEMQKQRNIRDVIQ